MVFVLIAFCALAAVIFTALAKARRERRDEEQLSRMRESEEVAAAREQVLRTRDSSVRAS